MTGIELERITENLNRLADTTLTLAMTNLMGQMSLDPNSLKVSWDDLEIEAMRITLGFYNKIRA